MLVPGGHVASGAVLIWVACADTGALVASEPELLLGSMSGSVVLQRLGSVVMSMVHVSTGGHWNNAVLRQP